MSCQKRANGGELIVPLAVVAVVGMMVFPLPIPVLDVLLVLNIGFALSLIIAAVYLNEPERFTALPAILLLSTLFRLGLNISTTRQILANGQAPDLVTAFGNFVVGGNLIVGAVIFLIVTIVQFMVIAKGAERVAEVAARFTLDAMPGKQMSIDADVRAGILSLSEARERRRELHRESKLYGALDGAMKFIKGDAIAGILITAINISAGLVLGVSQHRLSLADALQRYTIFTVGDGLVSQIPALLVSVAAGIAVTRVGSKDDSLIGREIFEQLGREPQAVSLTGGVLCLTAFVPGMPTIPFLALGSVMLVAANRGKRARAVQTEQNSEFRPSLSPALVVRLSAEALRGAKRENRLNAAFEELKAAIFERWGILLSDVGYELLKSDGSAFEVVFRGAKVHRGKFEDERIAEPLCAWLSEFLENHLAELVDDSQTRVLLDAHQQRSEDLINSLIPAVLSITALTSVFRELLAERVAVRELGVILQALADNLLEQTPARSLNKKSPEWDGQLKHELVSAARRALGRSIVEPLVDEEWRMECWALEPEMEDALYQTLKKGLPAAPKLQSALRESVVEAARNDFGRPIVLVSTKAIRAALKRMLRQVPQALVLAFEELPEELSLVIKGCLKVDLSAVPDSAAVLEKRVVPLRA